MKAQISDTIIYARQVFSVAGVNGDGLFDPWQHGLHPVAACATCLRGYFCFYEVSSYILILRMVCMWLGGLETDAGQQGKGPMLFGRRPLPPQEWTRCLVYEKLAEPVLFTGGLLLGAEFIEELDVHMGFHPAWKFRIVHELVFDKGELDFALDRSEEMMDLRKTLEGKPDEPGANISAWTDRCFSLKYEW